MTDDADRRPQRAHRLQDPPLPGKAWELKRWFDPIFALLWKGAVTVTLPWLLKGAIEFSRIPAAIRTLTFRADSTDIRFRAASADRDTLRTQVNAVRAEVRELTDSVRGAKKAACWGITSRERRYHAGCPREIEEIISGTGSGPISP